MKAKKLELGPKKCVKLHVKGKKEESDCPVLISKTLHEKSEMEKVDTVKYLGDYISSDGSNTVNIAEREKKGLGINAQVISLLKEVSLGSHFFDIGL